MSFLSLVACLNLALLLPFSAATQTPQTSPTAQATLAIACDADCSWNVDGDQHGVLKKGEEAHVEVLFGAHKVDARSPDGRLWEQTVEIKQPNEEQIRISFAPGSTQLEGGSSAEVPTEGGVQSDESAGGIRTFYAQARQVLVEAKVWDKTNKKNTTDTSWIPKAYLDRLTKMEAAYMVDRLKLLPPPARGLKPSDFRIFDNDAEQRVNYFKETDFPAVDGSGQWWYQATLDGVWGVAIPMTEPDLEPPSATYLVGYPPPPLKAGECHTIHVVVPGHEVDLTRNLYCDLESMNHPTTSETSRIYDRMRNFAASGKRGSFDVSIHPFVFWSSGVLSLVGGTGAASDPALPATGYTYVVEVHESKARASVDLTTDFVLPLEGWDVWHCLDKNPDALYVLGTVYKGTTVAGQFGGKYACSKETPAGFVNFYRAVQASFSAPTRFDTQIDLGPGDYNLSVVVYDGNKFGRAEAPLHVEALASQNLTMSDIVLSSVVRDASWVPRQAAEVSPAPITPTPLVSKNIQFFPEARTQVRQGSALFLYLEIYRPELEERRAVPSYIVRITNLKTGARTMDAGPISAADFVVPGNVVIPVGLKLDTRKLLPGSYRVQVQALDSVGRQSDWRSAEFSIN